MGWFSSLKKKVKKAVKKVVKTVKKIVRAVKEIINRALGVIDFLGSLIGIRPKKYLRLKIFILRSRKKPIVGVNQVNDLLDVTISIFKEKMNIEIRRTNLIAEEFIEMKTEDTPEEYLNVECSFGFTFSDAADYFDDNCEYTIDSASAGVFDLLGYGEPLYAFTVKSISNDKLGCAYPLVANFCVFTPKAGRTTLAHELSHLCGLRDRNSNDQNIMSSKRDRNTGYKLTRWQISVVRNSKYVVYVPRWG